MELKSSFQESMQQMDGCAELTPIEDHGEVGESEVLGWRDFEEPCEGQVHSCEMRLILDPGSQRTPVRLTCPAGSGGAQETPSFSTKLENMGSEDECRQTTWESSRAPPISSLTASRLVAHVRQSNQASRVRKERVA